MEFLFYGREDLICGFLSVRLGTEGPPPKELTLFLCWTDSKCRGRFPRLPPEHMSNRSVSTKSMFQGQPSPC